MKMKLTYLKTNKTVILKGIKEIYQMNNVLTIIFNEGESSVFNRIYLNDTPVEFSIFP